MAVSQNGYPANDRTQCATFVVSDANPGRRMLFRKGSPGELLAHMVRWFDKNVRDIDPGIMDDWSYAERPVRGSTDVLSNHASGTAADVDATKWPLGVQPEAYLTAAEIAKVRAQLKVYEGCIRWGGDYASRKDPMHFEINRDQATCDRVWAKIQTSEEDMPLNDADLAKIEALIQKHVETHAQRVRQVVSDGTRAYGLDSLRRKLDQLLGKPETPATVDPQAVTAIAAAVVAKLPASGGQAINPEDVANAVLDRLAESIRSAG